MKFELTPEPGLCAGSCFVRIRWYVQRLLYHESHLTHGSGTYFTGILAMTRFKNDFGTLQNGVRVITASNQSLFASIVQVGEVLGSLGAGFIGDRSGRKGALYVMHAP
jgi:MFS family permease